MVNRIDVEAEVSRILGRRIRDGQYVTVDEKVRLVGILSIGTVEMQCPRLHRVLEDWISMRVARAKARVKREDAGLR